MKPARENTWRRRALEIGFWPLIIGFFWTLDLYGKFAERARTGTGLDDFRLVTEQATSALAALCMVAFVVWWTRLFPVKSGQWLRTLLGHLAGSFLFALGHYTLIVLFRILAFHFSGRRYGMADSHLENLLFEYQKDIKIYVAMVAIVAGYRFWHERSAVPRRAPEPELPADRLVVQTGRGERILQTRQIDYLQAARNYVSIYADGEEHVVRDTLARLERALAAGRFVRTHRSYLVNLDRVREVRPGASGGWQVVLANGQEVPLSRSYRDPFRSLLHDG